jgi:hypothetical protein
MSKVQHLHPLQAKIQEAGLENVMSLKKQLTYEQCEKLIEEFCGNKKLIWNTLLEMENNADLKKKYISVYLTLRNWIKLKIDSGKVADPCKGETATGHVYTFESACTWVSRATGDLSQLETFFEYIGVDQRTGARLYKKRTIFHVK